MFVDAIKVTFAAGSGGNGVVAWRREKFVPKGGPSGGNGGYGGSIILEADTGLYSLESLRHKRIMRAENGMPGGGNLRKGRSGQDLVIKVPYGTLVKDKKTQKVLFDFTEEKKRLILCNGGRGGKGNACFRSPTNQAPVEWTAGADGDIKEVELELKLIADVGLIGMPNAGKSTLMSQMANIDVKIGAYPFTTLFPNLGFIELEDFSRIFIADIPGIIKNAHQDKGLGLSFLKHVERTRVLVFIIDISGQEERDPYEDFQILRDELKAYRADILEKPFIVVLNKIDMEGAAEQLKLFKERYPFDPNTLFEISALNGEGLKRLIGHICILAQAQGKRFLSISH